MTITIKRIYEPASRSDGMRVLVDRLWPRGIKKDRAKIDLWLKEIGPSTSLRQWFGHKPERWEKFRERYLGELSENEAVTQLRQLAKTTKHLTLVYSARDEEHNQAVVLAEYLGGTSRRRKPVRAATGSRRPSSR
jgi:uncharacterized protein YeaO (DUF488 family)